MQGQRAPEVESVEVDRPPARSVLRRNLTVSWVIGVVAFTLARFFVAQETLADYDLNIWLFGFIDLVTAVPYAVGVAKVVGALVDRDARGASWWVAVAGICFIAPYAYIALAGKDAELPTTVYAVLGGLVLVFGANAVWGIARKVRAGRALGELGAPADLPSPVH